MIQCSQKKKKILGNDNEQEIPHNNTKLNTLIKNLILQVPVKPKKERRF